MFLVVLVTSSCIDGFLATLSNGKGEERFPEVSQSVEGKKGGIEKERRTMGSLTPCFRKCRVRSVVSSTPTNRLALMTVKGSERTSASSGEGAPIRTLEGVSRNDVRKDRDVLQKVEATHSPTFMRQKRNRNRPSDRTLTSWPKKKMPISPSRSVSRWAVVTSPPKSVLE